MQIKPYNKNAKKHPKKQIEQVANSIKEFGMNQPIVVDKNGVIIVGHGRYEALKLLNWSNEEILKHVKVLDISEEKANAYRLADNKLNESEWDMGLVIEELKGLSDEMIDLTGFDKDLLDEKTYKDGIKSSLQENFIVPPFSIWDTKQGYWQDRKRLWISYIGYSGIGRDDNLLGEGLKKLAKISAQNYQNETSLTGTSIFDPVVAELSYKWFAPKGSSILDPFAGGHVRGSVAGILGYKYTGIDLSKKQILANKEKVRDLELKDVVYINENSSNLDKILVNEKYDLIFSCPPYFDLEQYDDGEGDLSMLENYNLFIKEYEEIIKKSVEKLKENRFIVWVVGDVRDKEGFYYGLIKDTVDAFKKAGASLYNEIILANAIATAPMRAKRPFDENRKVTKVHQNILCFYKGDKEMIKNYYIDLPQVHKYHENVLVFYNGDIEEIKKNYKAVDPDISYPLSIGI